MWRNFSRKFHDAAAVAARIAYRRVVFAWWLRLKKPDIGE
jgi:hypothetical protein